MFASNIRINGYSKMTGMAPVIEGKVGDLHCVSFMFPISLSVGTNGAPLGSTTLADGVNAVALDPFMFGPEMITALLQAAEYNIVSLRMCKELTNGQDATLSKGRLALAFVDDPIWPLYNAPTYGEVSSQENHVIWSLNSNEKGNKSNMEINYVNKAKKLYYTQGNIDQGEWKKTNEADVRQTYQLALVAAQIGAYVPPLAADVKPVGYMNCEVKVATYGRTPTTSISGSGGLMNRLIEEQMFRDFVEQPDAKLKMWMVPHPVTGKPVKRWYATRHALISDEYRKSYDAKTAMERATRKTPSFASSVAGISSARDEKHARSDWNLSDGESSSSSDDESDDEKAPKPSPAAVCASSPPPPPPPDGLGTDAADSKSGSGGGACADAVNDGFDEKFFGSRDPIKMIAEPQVHLSTKIHRAFGRCAESCGRDREAWLRAADALVKIENDPVDTYRFTRFSAIISCPKKDKMMNSRLCGECRDILEKYGVTPAADDACVKRVRDVFEQIVKKYSNVKQVRKATIREEFGEALQTAIALPKGADATAGNASAAGSPAAAPVAK